MSIGAVVLVGGQGRRIGRAKASVEIGGRTLCELVIDAVGALATSIVVVARDAEQDLPAAVTDCHLVHDRRPGSGPLDAIATGLSTLDGLGCDRAIVVACDLPFLDPAALRALVDRLEPTRDPDATVGVVPTVGGRTQPLCAAWAPSLHRLVDRLIADGETRAMRLVELPGVIVLDDRETAAIDPDGGFGFDVDTPEQLAAARRRLGT